MLFSSTPYGETGEQKVASCFCEISGHTTLDPFHQNVALEFNLPEDYYYSPCDGYFP